MLNRDTVIGVVGAALLVSAMAGVFAYERAQSASLGTGFVVLWETTDLAPIEGDGTTGVGERTEAALEVTAANMTNLTWTLSWTAGPQSRDTLRLTVVPPEGMGEAASYESEPSDSGTITLSVPVPNPVPATTSAGADDDATRARLAQEHTSTLGTGNWTFVVEFVSAAGPAPGPAATVGADTSVQWTIAAVPQVYAPVIEAAN